MKTHALVNTHACTAAQGEGEGGWREGGHLSGPASPRGHGPGVCVGGKRGGEGCASSTTQHHCVRWGEEELTGESANLGQRRSWQG